MWPKLLEVMLHLRHLVPMLEKFLNSRQANDRANEATLKAMAEEVRGDLAQVTAAHGQLYRQLQDQNAQIAALEGEIRLAREAAERAEAAVRVPDAGAAALMGWVKGGVVGLTVLLVVVIVLLLRRG